MNRRFGILALAVLIAWIGGCSNPRVRAAREFAFNQPWDSPAQLVVDTRNGGIDVLCGVGEKLSVSGVIHAYGTTDAEAEERLAELDVVAERDSAAGACRVYLKRPPVDEFDYGARITVRVPAACTVHADTSNGAVRVERALSTSVGTSNGGVLLASIEGDAVVSTSNGSIDARTVSGSLSGGTSNGGLTLKEIHGGTTLRTSNGGVEAEGLGGEVSLVSSNGSARVDLGSVPCRGVSVETSNGSIHVIVPAEFAANLNLSTSNGKIYRGTCGDRIAITSSTQGSLIARLNGGGAPIKCDTSNGTVTITCR